MTSNRGYTYTHVNKLRMLKKPLLIRRSAFPEGGLKTAKLQKSFG